MILDAMPEADYHSHNALSSTGARLLLDSPARFKYWQEHPQPSKQTFDVGTAAHSKILGVGAGVVLYPDEFITPSGEASRSKAALEWVAEQRAAGLVPIGRADADRVDAMSEAVLADPDAKTVFEQVVGREVSIITEVDGVPVRARFDLYDGVRGGDLKTARDASPKAFNRAVGAYGYHIQERWYTDAHRAETGNGLESFKFVVVESAPPHLVGVYELDFMWDEIAAVRVRQARDVYRACVESGVWSGYGARSLTPPTWAVYESEEEINV